MTTKNKTNKSLTQSYLQNLAIEEPVNPSEINKQWELKGYDVADKYFISAISNCGCGIEEICHLREAWQDAINTSGLMADIASARCFKEHADNRIPSHAPFFIYGLYVL